MPQALGQPPACCMSASLFAIRLSSPLVRAPAPAPAHSHTHSHTHIHIHHHHHQHYHHYHHNYHRNFTSRLSPLRWLPTRPTPTPIQTLVRLLFPLPRLPLLCGTTTRLRLRARPAQTSSQPQSQSQSQSRSPPPLLIESWPAAPKPLGTALASTGRALPPTRPPLCPPTAGPPIAAVCAPLRRSPARAVLSSATAAGPPTERAVPFAASALLLCCCSAAAQRQRADTEPPPHHLRRTTSAIYLQSLHPPGDVAQNPHRRSPPLLRLRAWTTLPSHTPRRLLACRPSDTLPPGLQRRKPVPPHPRSESRPAPVCLLVPALPTRLPPDPSRHCIRRVRRAVRCPPFF